MEKLEKLEKLKILRDGQEVDAYLNIAESSYAWIKDKSPIDYAQTVTEYEGERDIRTIPKLLNKKIVNDNRS